MTNGWVINEGTGYKGKHELKIYVEGQLVENLTSHSLEYLNQFIKDQHSFYFKK